MIGRRAGFTGLNLALARLLFSYDFSGREILETYPPGNDHIPQQSSGENINSSFMYYYFRNIPQNYQSFSIKFDFPKMGHFMSPVLILPVLGQ